MATKRQIIWSEYKYYVPPFLNIVASILIYSAGFYFSSPEDGIPLSRSGSLATAFAIGFTLWDYRKILIRQKEIGVTAFSDAVQSMGLNHQDPDELIKKFTKKMDGKTNSINNRITYAQTGVLIIATLVWGFGDCIIAVIYS